MTNHYSREDDREIPDTDREHAPLAAFIVFWIFVTLLTAICITGCLVGIWILNK